MRSTRVLRPAEVAWIAALPCALLTYAGVHVLGPPLGRAILGPGPEKLWSNAIRAPEPIEHGRYVIALLVLPLVAAVVLAGTRLRVALRSAAIRVLLTVGQIAVVGFVADCLLAQQHLVAQPDRFFTPRVHALAAVLPLVLVLVLRNARATAFVVRATLETRQRRIACWAAAAALTAVWLLTAINFDSTIGTFAASHLLPWDTDEAYAVLDGRTPLVNFHAQYGQLWAYVAAAIMALAGTSLGLLTTVLATTSGLVLLGVYGILRRIVRSSLLALAIYLPVMATSFFIFVPPLDNRVSPANIFSVWPLRYGGAYLLAWLTARHVDDAAPRRAATLFVIAGLVAINNVEFGVAAFVATLFALACAAAPRSRREVMGLLGSAVGGLAGAFLIVSLLTLVHSGQLPRFSLLLEFPRLYGKGGWTLVPMPTIGLHLVVFVTFVAAGVVAVVRALSEEERLLTAMLAWSAVFGLLAGSYYVGRSDALDLITMFSAWAFSLALLLVAVVRSLVASRRWPSLPELAIMFGFGLAVCSLGQLPAPWSQIARLRHHTPIAMYKRPGVERFVAANTSPGSDVALLLPMGHRIAYDLGRTNIAPYSGVEAMVSHQQVRATIELLRRRHIHRVFLGIRDITPGYILPEVLLAFNRAGFAQRAQWSDVSELSNERGAAHPHG